MIRGLIDGDSLCAARHILDHRLSGVLHVKDRSEHEPLIS